MLIATPLTAGDYDVYALSGGQPATVISSSPARRGANFLPQCLKSSRRWLKVADSQHGGDGNEHSCPYGRGTRHCNGTGVMRQVRKHNVYSLPLWSMASKAEQVAVAKNSTEIVTLEDHLVDGGWLMDDGSYCWPSQGRRDNRSSCPGVGCLRNGGLTQSMLGYTGVGLACMVWAPPKPPDVVKHGLDLIHQMFKHLGRFARLDAQVLSMMLLPGWQIIAGGHGVDHSFVAGQGGARLLLHFYRRAGTSSVF